MKIRTRILSDFDRCFVCRESPRSSQHYSKHSSLMTDLSLTPSPPAHQPPSSPKPENQPRDVDTPDNDDSDDGSKSTSSSSSSSGSSSFDHQPQSRTADDSLTTPQVIRCSEELTDDISQSPPASPHFNTPDLAVDPDLATEATVMVDPGLNLSSFQHRDILGLQGPASSSSLSLSLDLPTCSSTPKPGINNNLVTSSPGLASPYCSPSPAYSIPSPGSAFSVVISRRRESES